VLGAGASMSYGMPSGAELRSEICSKTLWLTRELEKFGVNSSKTSDFIHQFSLSNVASIDAFLSRHDRFVDIGKRCIAATLCAKENPSNVMNNDANDHWYQHMWQILIAGAATHNDLLRNKIRFVTFNYDRSLEYFLHQSTKYTYGVSDEEALSVVKKINILHVYGALGEFSFMPTKGTRQYTHENNPSEINVAAEGIKIIPEARDEAQVFETARKWFYESEIIGFLGFGFDTLNVNRLGLSDVLGYQLENGKPIATVIASTFKKTAAEAKKIRRMLWPKADSLGRTSYIETHGHENTMTIRESDLLD
jgi:flagellar biosynthesis regulator FlaF